MTDAKSSNQLFKPGDQVRHSNGHVYTVSKNHKPDSILIECTDEKGSGFTLFRGEVELLIPNAMPQVDLDQMEVFIASELEYAHYIRVKPMLAEIRRLRGSAVETPCSAADYEEVLADHRRLVRELDAALNGEGAAPQASLCDIVSQVKDRRWRLIRAVETFVPIDYAEYFGGPIQPGEVESLQAKLGIAPEKAVCGCGDAECTKCAFCDGDPCVCSALNGEGNHGR